MRHARPDYNRFQDPAGLVPADEPVFLLRGKDVNAPAAVVVWARHTEESGGDAKIVQAALAQAKEMLEWQATYGAKVADLAASSEVAKAPKEKMTASEALFGFMGWLTTREKEVTFSGHHDAALAAELVVQFCKTNNLPEPREAYYPANLTHPTT